MQLVGLVNVDGKAHFVAACLPLFSSRQLANRWIDNASVFFIIVLFIHKEVIISIIGDV